MYIRNLCKLITVVYGDVHVHYLYQGVYSGQGEVLMVTPQHISNLSLFMSMLEFCDDNDQVIELPEVKELKEVWIITSK